MNAPKHATEAECSAPELEAEVDEAIRMCGGDVRGALRATLVANAYHFTLADQERKRRMMSHYLDLSALVPVFRLRFAAGRENLEALLDAVEATLPRLSASA